MITVECDGLRNTLFALLEFMAKDAGKPFPAECRDTLALCRLGFDCGLLDICPPGERYKLNAAGRAWVATAPPFVGVKPPYGFDGWPSEGGKWIGFDAYVAREQAGTLPVRTYSRRELAERGDL